MRTPRSGRPVLQGRHLVLGISGGIAAYKAAYLARRLHEAGSQVRTVMTGGALRFLGEQTMAAITGHAVVTTLFGSDQAGPSPHTELARWADALVVAPATANVLAKVANGLADDALTATVAALTWSSVGALRSACARSQWPWSRTSAAPRVSLVRRALGETERDIALGGALAAAARRFVSTLGCFGTDTRAVGCWSMDESVLLVGSGVRLAAAPSDYDRGPFPACGFPGEPRSKCIVPSPFQGLGDRLGRVRFSIAISKSSSPG